MKITIYRTLLAIKTSNKLFKKISNNLHAYKCMQAHMIYKYKLKTCTYPFGFELQRIRKMKHRSWMKNLCSPNMSFHINKKILFISP